MNNIKVLALNSFLTHKEIVPKVKFELDLSEIKYSELLLMDGTFKSCPFDFYQVYIIHASVRGKVYTFLYAHLDRKNKSQYVELFEYVKMLIVHKNLKRIIVDLEKPCMEACEMGFPMFQ
ncbi:hypothetical protein NGRA_2862 [Nosema granulosis]|uniref:MULE transposase domain-containing protein n=1 Tax=Nosema granulosis TaxID=83296 RepID=A0A9P6KY82_9MICR|nr:hypothetical protein NGRA_2862 [Nosema granulosis]